MGVSGCGKSEVGRALARRLGAAYVEGDDLHPPENKRAMSEGRPLDDAMRAPWLDAVAREAEEARRHGDVVVACSALKRAYRDRLRAGIGRLGLVFLDPPREVLERRVAHRPGHYMPASLLGSQIAALEPPDEDEDAVRIDRDDGPEAAAEVAARAITQRAPGPG